MKKIIFILVACVGLLPLHSAMAEELVLKAATQAYPHMRALQDGQVKAQGCELRFSTQTLPALNRDLAVEHVWDVLEVELLPYMIMKSTGALADYTLIPVFPSRAFQLRHVFIRTDSGIKTPADFRGKKIGVPSHADTTLIWVRGILQSSWSVKPEDVTWKEATPSTLSDWLITGQVDAIITPKPSSALEKNAKTKHLFPDYKMAEYDQFKETRVFPITTAIAVKKSLIKDHAWLPESLFRAFSESKKRAIAAHVLPLPWGGSQEETEQLMGKNFWSYGVKSNPKTLRALFRYAEEQKVLHAPLTIEDVFDSSTLLLLED